MTGRTDDLGSLIQERYFTFGASAAWLSPDSAFILTNDPHEMKFEVDSFSIVHHCYLPIDLPQLVTAARLTTTCLTEFGFTCMGSGWTGMPDLPLTGILHSRKTSAALLTIGDPSANISALNVRHVVSQQFDPPLPVDADDGLMIELQSPPNGDGGSRNMRIYSAYLKITSSTAAYGTESGTPPRYASAYRVPQV